MKTKSLMQKLMFGIGLSLLLAALYVGVAYSASQAEGLRVTELIPAGDAAHPFDTLEIQFNADVMAGTFTLADITLTGPGGAISPIALTQLTASRYQLSSTGLTGLDIYQLKIGPEVRDLANQPMDQNKDGVPGQAQDAYQASLFSKAATLTDATYDHSYLVIYGSTLTLDGLHQFTGVALLGNSQMTHPAATTSNAYGLELNIIDTLSIESGSKIDVSNRGYLMNRTTGNTTTGGATLQAGGSYGGLGFGNGANWTYGDYRNPAEPGSGGGTTWGAGAAGGGLVRISAGNAIIDGSILANGGNGAYASTAGSGGGIRLEVDTLSGSGLIAANGGNGGSGGSGGGGRVAVYYETNNGLDLLANVQAHGGTGGEGAGAVGSVYLKDTNPGGEGMLRIDSHGNTTASWTPLGQISDTSFEVDHLVLSGAGVVAAPDHEIRVNANNVSLYNSAVLTHRDTTAAETFSLQMAITGTLTVSTTASIDVSNRGYFFNHTTGNTTIGGATGQSGGSYGGLGYSNGANWTYGDYRNPAEPGSGGGNTWSAGRSGGGLVRISAGSTVIDGSILANGGNGAYASTAGSGGGIRLEVGTLSGSGLIAANGGNGGSGGSGGGGRVAVYYETNNGLDLLANVQAHGGTGGEGAGAVGSVYLKDTNPGGEGILRIDSHGKTTASWTPLGQISDTAFDVDHLVLSGAGVVAAPDHEIRVNANNVSLYNSAVLTHRYTTAAETFSLQMAITGTLTVSTTTSIDVSNRGYLFNHTTGNTTTGGATGQSGGSYGGLGYSNGANWTYGDYRNPAEPGSGGGTTWGAGAAGGGLVRISAGNAIIDGSILAKGGNGAYASTAGSGGGIRLEVGTLSGSGLIAANGGNGGSGGSGGGGRVAVYYETNNGLDLLANVQAHGGTGGEGAGAVGSVYLKDTNPGGEGMLRIDSHGNTTASWTPLGQISDTSFEVDHLVLSGAGVVAAPRHDIPIEANQVTLVNDSILTHRTTTKEQVFALRLQVTGTLYTGVNASIDVSNRGYLFNRTTGNTTTGGATGQSGGSYGGLGHSTGANWTYGDYRDPAEPGSGGGMIWSAGGSGGGLVRISAGSTVIDGSILANGGNGAYAATAGSGGGIRLEVGTLSGSGLIAANGGNGGSGGSGGGGRVAVYYGSASEFGLLTSVQAHGGTGGEGAGAVGSVYLKDTNPGGEGMLRIDSHGNTTASWTPLGQPGDETFEVDHLVLSGAGVVAAPDHGNTLDHPMLVIANNVSLYNGAVLTHRHTTAAETFSLQMAITGTLTISTTGSIDVTNRGYLFNHTTGNTTTGGATGQSGGSYGGLGFGAGANGIYGNYLNPTEPGSGGGTTWGAGAAGGGLMRISAGSTVIDGSILANGGNGAYAATAGSGGGILLETDTLSGSGLIAANGGSGGSGGSGGGGRVAVYYYSRLDLPQANITANGGSGGEGPGSAGSVHSSNTPVFIWTDSWDTYFHDSEQVGWHALGVTPGTLQVKLGLSGVGAPVPLGQSLPQTGKFSFDTLPIPDGAYQLNAEFYNQAGQLIGQISRSVLINNSLIWHAGFLDTSQVWSADRVHGIDGDLYISTGITLTLQAGTIVKNAAGMKWVVMDGGRLEAEGSLEVPIILTSLSDDLAGGDSNLDGHLTVPYPGEWQSIHAEGTGQLNLNPYVEVRYARLLHSGILATDQTWTGKMYHEASGDVIVPNGVTLTIEAGAIIKFHHRTHLIVETGGRLVAVGNVAQPISFTSLADDSLGGDTNGDRDATLPAPGDWIGIQVAGSATLDHVLMAYGAGSMSGNYEYPTSTFLQVASGSNVQLSNSVLRDGQFEGIVDRGNVQVINTVIARNDRGINLDGNSTLVNVTLDSNRIGLWCHFGGGTATNVIVSNSLESGVSGNCIPLGYSNVWSTTGINYTGIDQAGLRGNVSVDPQYKNANTDQFQLRYLSPMIDSADGAAAPLSDAMGAPRYDDPRVANTGPSAPGGAFADMGAFEFVEDALSPIDLVVDWVRAPSEISAGSWITISWQVRNVGLFTDTLTTDMQSLTPEQQAELALLQQATGPWHDQISLVAQVPLRGVIEVPVAEVLSEATLGPGQAVIFQARVRVPGGTEGQWRWRIHTNTRGEVFEGRNWQNNGSPLIAESALRVPKLAPGAPQNGSFQETGQAAWYQFEQPAGEAWEIRLDLQAADGRTRLYAGYDSMPTLHDYDQVSMEWNSPDAVLDLPASAITNTVYVMAVAENLDAVNQAYTLSAIESAFAFQGLGLSEAGNVGLATIPIYGSGFTSQLEVYLRLNSSWITATQITALNSISALATFDLNGAVEGLYDVVLKQTGATVSQATIFTVIAGSGGRFEARIFAPQNVRQGRVIQGMVEYANVGDADLLVPLMIIQSSSGNPLWLDTDWIGGQTLQILGAPTEGIFHGILAPGQSYSLRFLSRIGGSPVIYSLAWKDAYSTDPLDWDSLGAAVLGDATPLRQQAWRALEAEIGSATGEYIQALTQAYEEARNYGLNLPTVRSILMYMLERQVVRLPGAVVSGTIVDAASQLPVGRAVILLVNSTSGETFMAQAWYDGSFALRDAPTGDYQLVVQEYQPNPADTLSLTGTPISGLKVKVSPGAELSGSVLNAASYPVYAAIVNLKSIDDGKLYTTHTDGLGAYIIRGLPDGTYLLEIYSDEYVYPGAQQLELKAGQVNGFSMVLNTGGSISGVIKAPAGIPMANAEVRPMYSALQSGGPSALFYKAALTGPDGSYSIAGLPTGVYEVQATAPGYGAASLADVQVTAGADTLVDLTLTNSATVSGAVLAAETNQPLAGTSISTDAPRYGDDPLVTDAQGKFSLPDLPAGVYHVWALADNRVTQGYTVTLTGGQAQMVNFNLHKLGSIGGILKTTSGAILADIPITLQTYDGQQIVQNTSSTGQFSFTGLWDGHYILSIGQDSSQVSGRHEFDLDGNKNTYSVNLKKDLARLTGQVISSNGSPVISATVGLLKDGNLISTIRTDDQGTYQFLVFSTGPVDIVAVSEQAGILRLEDVLINPGLMQAPDLQAGQTTLTVQVQRDETGNPAVEGATVALMQEWAGETFPGVILFGTSGADGSYLFPALAPGDYDLIVLAPGLETTRRSLTLGAAGGSETFALRRGRSLIGVVLDANNIPIQGALVQAVDQLTGILFNAMTDEIGYYEFNSLPAGEFDVWVSENAHGFSHLGILNTQGAGTIAANVTLASSYNTVAGNITASGGLPLLNATVRLINQNGQPLLVSFTDLQGNYEIPSLPEGSATLNIAAPGYLYTTRPVTVTAGSVQAIDANLGQLLALAITSSDQALRLGPLSIDVKAYGPYQADPLAITNWQNWALGTPPEPERHATDTVKWRFSFLEYDISDSCPQAQRDLYWEELNKAEASQAALDKAYLRWLQQHDVLEDLGTTSMDAAAAQTAEIGIKTAELLVMLEGAGVTNPATKLSPVDAALGRNINLVKSSATSLVKGIQKGDLNAIDYSMGVIKNISINELQKAVGGPVITGPLKIIEIIQKMIQLYDDWDQSTRATIDALGQYQQTEDWYYQAFSNHLANIEAVKAAARVCPTATPTATRETATPTKTGATPTPTPIKSPTPRPTGTQPPCAKPPCLTPPPPTPPYPSPGPSVVPTEHFSRDPNEKVSIGVGSQGFVARGTTLLYTIYFENVSTASAAAQEVYITDALNSQLDWSSVELVSIGFNNVVLNISSGSQQYSTRAYVATDPNPIKVTAGLNPDTGVLSWSMISVDPATGMLTEDPLAGFLPPNDEQQSGEGYVTFSVKPKANLANGAVIKNKARIVFDVNPPIDTQEVTNTIDEAIPTSQVISLPAISPTRMRVSWSGSDGNGSGVDYYDIYVSVDGGEFVLWLGGAHDTQATFTGQAEHTYAFYSIAVDKVGNHEIPPDGPDAQTLLRNMIFLPITIR